MLLQLEEEQLDAIASFLPHGRAFMIHDVQRFCDEVLPRFFNNKNYQTFVRQLHLYGFRRAVSKKEKGSYYHALFLRSRPSLVRYMRRVGLSKGKSDRRKTRGKDRGEDPDFWSMKPAYDLVSSNYDLFD